MVRRVNKHQRPPGVCATIILFMLANKVSCSQVLVCSPDTGSEPLTCNSNQWVRISSETYAPQTHLQGSLSCQQNISGCNTYFYDTGMQINCNGPALQDGKGCMEKVNVANARSISECLRNVPEVATLVEYDCIEGSKVLNMCEPGSTLTLDVPIYLASPNYPRSTAQGSMCTCTIQGSNIKMSAVEIEVTSRLPWEGEASDGDKYNSVFTVSSNVTNLWRSNDCVDCSTRYLVNSNLFLPDESTNSPEIEMSYSDYGLPAQNVWVEIYNSEKSLNITCSSSPLPHDKIVTTTTLKTTSATFITTTMKPTNIITSLTSTSSQVIFTETKSSVPSQTTHEGIPIAHEGEKKNDSVDSVVLTVTLSVLLILLAVTAVILGVLIHRKRHKFKSDDYIGPWDFLQSCCQGSLKDQQNAPNDHGNFDAVAMQDKPCHKSIQNCTQNDLFGDEDVRAESYGKQTLQNVPNEYCLQDKDYKQMSLELFTNNGESLIPQELYQSHQEMLDKEVEKMRQKRYSRNDIISTDNNPLDETNA